MDLIILMKFINKTNKNHSYTKRIEYCGIKEFRYTKDFIFFVEFGRLSETQIATENIIEFAIQNNDNLFD